MHARRFGPFELERELGRGANGVVYLASRSGDPARYALKINTASLDGDSTARFKVEGDVIARLKHPGIVRGLEQGVINGRQYLLMEYCEGEPLSDRLKRGRIPWAEAVALVTDLARTLGAAHATGVIHRDLKPDNVILEASSGRPRVIDFGLARDPSLVRSLTQSQVMLGTPLTMAPEQYEGERADSRADVYALGVILYMCLTGEPPFDSESRLQLQVMVCLNPPTPPRRLASDIPPAIERACLAALAKQRDERPFDGNAFAAVLDRALAQATQPRAKASAPFGWAFAGALVVGLAAGFGIWLLGGADSSAPAVGSQKPPTPADPAPQEDPEQHAAVGELIDRSLDLAREEKSLEELLVPLEDAERLAGDDVALLARVQLARATMRLRRGDYDGARREAPIEAPGEVGVAARFAEAFGYYRTAYAFEARVRFRMLANDPASGDYGRIAAALLDTLDHKPWSEVLEHLEQADPGRDLVRLIRAVSLADQGRLPDALASIEEVERAEPDDPNVKYLKLLAQTLGGDQKGAQETCDRIAWLTRGFGSVGAALRYAEIRVRQRDVEGALKILKKALETRPDCAQIHAYLGTFLLERKRTQEATEAFKAAYRYYSPANLTLAIARLPEAGAGGLAAIRRQAGERPLVDDGLRGEAAVRAILVETRGLSLRKQCPMARLEPLFARARLAAGGDAELGARVQLARAEAQRRRGLHVSALGEAPVGAAGETGFAARLLVAICHLRLGDLEASRQALAELADDDPGGLHGQHARALLLIAAKRPWEEVQPHVHDPPRNLHCKLIAITGLPPAEAKRALEQLAQEEPDEPHIHYLRLGLQFPGEDPRDLLPVYDAIVKLAAKAPPIEVLLKRSWTLTISGNPMHGLIDANRVIASRPQSVRGHVLRGLALIELGRREEGLGAWEEACHRRNPTTWERDVRMLEPEDRDWVERKLKELEQGR